MFTTTYSIVTARLLNWPCTFVVGGVEYKAGNKPIFIVWIFLDSPILKQQYYWPLSLIKKFVSR